MKIKITLVIFIWLLGTGAFASDWGSIIQEVFDNYKTQVPVQAPVPNPVPSDKRDTVNNTLGTGSCVNGKCNSNYRYPFRFFRR